MQWIFASVRDDLRELKVINISFDSLVLFQIDKKVVSGGIVIKNNGMLVKCNWPFVSPIHSKLEFLRNTLEQHYTLFLKGLPQL